MHRLYVTYTIPDARGLTKKKYFNSLGLKNKIGAVRVVDCYTIDAKLNSQQIEKAKQLLANPLMQNANFQLSTFSARGGSASGGNFQLFSHAIEIGFLPGVTDNVGHTAKETLIDGAKVKFKHGQNVYSSQVFFVYLKKNNSKRSAKALATADISSNVSPSDIKKIAYSLHNPLIQKAQVTSRDEYTKAGGLPINLPKVKLTGSSKVIKVDLNVSDEELELIGKLGIAEQADKSAHYKDDVVRPFMGKRRGPLALGLEELKTIRDYFNSIGRQPTDIELETLAQTWSEHCKHTIFADPIDELKNGLYKTYIKGATEIIRARKNEGNPRAARGLPSSKDFCVSVFTDNAGGISFDKNYIISHKVETHNTPSALDPFGGSITGIGGVNRDALGFGLGAKPIANFYGFCLADPEDKTKLYRDKELKSPMLSSRRIMEGVIAGINAGGNQSGIPTPLGFLYFNSRFRGKPLVFAGTLGLIPKKIAGRLGHEKKAKLGDLIVMIGGRVGADGIHGATFSSEGLDTHSPATAVQIGDPITQKKFSDAIAKEARDLNLYNSITDCGAGGLSSAVGEMAKEAGDSSESSRAKSRGGCEVNIDKVPLKYPGLAPWQTWISESQERMVLAVPKNKWPRFEKLMKSRGVEATSIGEFTKTGNCVVRFNNKTILDIDMEFLHNGRPKKHLKTIKPKNLKTHSNLTRSSKIFNLKSSILNLLSRLNITSYEFISQQYDHEVQGSSVLKPLQGRGRVNSDAAVIRPVLNSPKGAVLSYGLQPHLSEIDPYAMAAASIDSAIRAAVAAGADVDYLALLDNFCWCSPEDPKRLWQLKQAARACYDVSISYGTPFISGKDSMHNDFKGYGGEGKALKISIPPTLLISALGIVPDITKTVSLDVKAAGDLIYILGSTHNELGGSEYFKMMNWLQRSAPIYGQSKKADKSAHYMGTVPTTNPKKNYKIYKAIFNCNQKNLIASAISVNRGGLATALSKTLIAGGLGAEIDLATLPGDWSQNYQALFSESQGRILVSVDPKKVNEFEKLMAGNAFSKIGKITSRPHLIIGDKLNKQIINLNLNKALKAYKASFKDW